jgi:hypothetical protein
MDAVKELHERSDKFKESVEYIETSEKGLSKEVETV